MKGEKEANRLTKELRRLEQGIVKGLVVGRRYGGYDWPEHRVAVHVRGQVQKDGSVRGMGLLIFTRTPFLPAPLRPAATISPQPGLAFAEEGLQT
jgi:hypothetical protein